MTYKELKVHNPGKQITFIVLCFVVSYGFRHIMIMFVGVILENNYF